MTARRALDEVKARLAQIVAIVAAVLRPVVVGGLVAVAIIALALVPWMFHSTGATIVWAVIVLAGVAAALRLMWHTRLLRRTLGDPAFIDDTIGAAHTKSQEHYARLNGELGDVLHGVEGRRKRNAVRVLMSLRTVSAVRDVTETSSRFIEPVSPQRLVLTAYAAVVLAAAMLLVVPVVLFSLIGLLLR